MFDDLANRQIGDFIIQERLGSGAMSVVYRAVQQSVNRSVALKIINLNQNPLAKENYQPYFIQEARVIAMLEHIHIVPIYNYGRVDAESSYIALRLLRGGSVAELLREGPMNLYRALDIFIQAGQGLAHAHGRGIIHRDLKPSNILLDELGNAYLTDFGLGKLAEVSLDLTESGNVIGTPLYASPEQILGDEIDHRSDIYSMSAMLYHMLGGRPPFDIGNDGLIELIQKHQNEQPPPLNSIEPSIPPEISDAIGRGLSRSPDARPNSLAELAESLNVELGRRISRGTITVIESKPPETAPAGAPQPSRRWLPIVAIVALLITLGAFALLTRPQPPPRVRVVAGERGIGENVVPTAAEIESARSLLGERQFIAYIACALENEDEAIRVRAFTEQLDAYGIPMRAYDSALDRYRQQTLIERARLEGARALVLCTLDGSALETTLRSVEEAGIPLIFLTPHEPLYGGVQLDGDDLTIGHRAGELAAGLINREMNGTARVLLLEYPGISMADLRAEGIEAALNEAAPDATIVERVPAMTVATGQAVVADALQRGVEFDLIVAVSDAAALGAARALERGGIGPSEMPIVSIDGQEDVQQMIRNDYYLRGTVEVDLAASARIAADVAVRLLGGGEVPEYLSLPVGGIFTKESEAVTLAP